MSNPKLTNLVSIDGEREKRKEPCVYCGNDPHVVPLACPRIATVWINSEGYVEGIDFRDGWDEPKLAG